MFSARETLRGTVQGLGGEKTGNPPTALPKFIPKALQRVKIHQHFGSKGSAGRYRVRQTHGDHRYAGSTLTCNLQSHSCRTHSHLFDLWCGVTSPLWKDNNVKTFVNQPLLHCREHLFVHYFSFFGRGLLVGGQARIVRLHDRHRFHCTNKC